MINLLRIYLLLCTILIVTKNSAQISKREIPIDKVLKSINPSELKLKKQFIGKIETSVDSSLFYKYKSNKSSKTKISIEKKSLGNIGFGNELNVKNTFTTFQSPIEGIFDGFEIIKNSNYPLSNISVESGLVSNNITKVYEDSNGNIWLGYASGGISKLNSSKITNYGFEEGFSSDMVTDIIEYNNEIWVGTFGGGIFKLNQNKLTTINQESQFPSNHILTFCLDNDSNLWIGTYGKGIIRYDGEHFYQIKNIVENASGIINKIVLDSVKNNIWYFDDASNIFEIDNAYNLNVVNLVNKSFKYEVVDISFNESLFALLSDNRLAVFNPKIVEVNTIEAKGRLVRLINTKSGNNWIGSSVGEIFIGKDDYYSRIDERHGLGTEGISDIFADKSNNVWISSFGGGITMSYASSFQSLINDKDPFYTNNTVIGNYAGNLMFTDADGFGIIGPSEILMHYKHPSLKDIKGITSNNDKIWLANFDGVYEVTGDSLFLFKNPLPSQFGYNSNTNIKYLNGKLYVNNYNYGWYEYSISNNTWTKFDVDDNLTFTTSTFIDSKNRRWIGSVKGGINYCFEGENIGILKKSGIINDFCEDKQGNIWISSSQGLFQYSNDSKLYKYEFNKDINQVCQSIYYYEDLNALWIGTTTNLIFFDLNNERINTFNNQSGINGITFSRANVLAIKPHIYWVTNKSIVKFNPYVFKAKINKLEIKLNTIQFDFENVDFQSLRKNEEISYDKLENNIPVNPKFPKNNKTINFIFTSNLWGKESNINYYYKVDENSEWIGPIVNGEIIMSNTQVGKHTLFVKGVGYNQTESNIISYPFEITQPFYLKFWFISIIITIVFVLGLLTFIVRSNFDFSNFKSYSTYSIYLKRLRFMAILFSIAFPLMELFILNLYDYIATQWILISIISFLGIVFILSSFVKNISETLLSIFALINSTIITLFLLYRLELESFNNLFIIETAVIIAFATIVFDNIRLFFVYWLIVAVAGIYMLAQLSFSSENEFNFLFAISLILSFALIFHIFQVNKIGKVVFADKILNTYDKLVLVYNLKGDVVYVNPYLNNFFQKEDNYILGKEWYTLRNCSPTNTENIRRDINRQITSQQPFHTLDEVIFSSLHNENRTIEWTFQLIEDEFLMAIGSDVTFVREQQARISLLSKVSESVSNGVVIRDADDNIIWCNESFENLIQYSLSEIVGQRPSKFFKFPEFYKNDLTQFDNKQGANMISVEIPILTKKNNLVWLLMNETVIYNDSGEVIQFISIVSDITEKKEKEIDFERLSLVAKHTQNPIIILKNDLTIEWVNVAFVSEFGYQENEVYGFYPGKILKGQNSDKSKFTEFERIVVKGEKASGEFLLYNKASQSIWVQVSVDPVFDTDGNITKYICLMQNIQAVKDAQQIIASKNKDITDSINYAKRIQAALLPNLKLLRKNLPDFFIYYKPKDVVSGDFYYMEIIRNKVIIAIADCTGHGVPGAMMTSIGASGLNNAILDKKLSDPGKILEHLDLYVKSSLSARSEDITDGMDIGVIAFNFEKNTVEYCGAKRPLITFKANGEMQIIEGKKRSIGEFVFGEGSNFETTSISIKEDLSIYCFSDGITDQFGGANKKKLYIKYLLEFLESKQNLSMKAQEQAVQELLTTWTNDNEIPQTDDIVVFGAKVGNDYFNKMKKLISKSGI